MKETDIIVYLDSYVKYATGDNVMSIDFRLEKDLSLFTEALRETMPQYGFSRETGGTYLRIRGYNTRKRLRTGCYYRLNTELLRSAEFQGEGSYSFAGTLDFTNARTGTETELLDSHSPLNPDEMSAYDNGTLDLNVPVGDMELYVANVRQANWNELRCGGKAVVVYDIGAPLNAGKIYLDELVRRHQQDYAQGGAMLVISHWDIDHYQCLLAMSDNEIRHSFSCMAFPGIYKTLTAKRAIDKMRGVLGENHMHAFQPAQKQGQTRNPQMKSCWASQPVALYIGERSRNINFSGLCMFVDGTRRSAMFTGDCKLSQAYAALTSARATISRDKGHVLVCPHHGGDYGKAARRYAHCDMAAISVGRHNSYGHPDKLMMEYLCQLTCGNVKETRNDHDIVESI